METDRATGIVPRVAKYPSWYGLEDVLGCRHITQDRELVKSLVNERLGLFFRANFSTKSEALVWKGLARTTVDRVVENVDSVSHKEIDIPMVEKVLDQGENVKEEEDIAMQGLDSQDDLHEVMDESTHEV